MVDKPEERNLHDESVQSPRRHEYTTREILKDGVRAVIGVAVLVGLRVALALENRNSKNK